MVRRFRNHPSIFIWSLGNEEPEQGTRRGQRVVATMQQLGFNGYEASSWIGIFGPAKLPANVVSTVNRSLNEWLSSEEGAKKR